MNRSTLRQVRGTGVPPVAGMGCKRDACTTGDASGTHAPRGARKQLGPRGGSALIVALWAVGLLAMIVGSFAFDARIELHITSYYQKRTKATYLANSGVQVAEMLMLGSAGMSKGQEKTAEDEDDAWYDQKKKLAEGLPIRGLDIEVGDGMVTVDIVPEPARRNVNLLKEDDWERVLEVGGIPEDLDLWPELIDSFYDWTDGDDDPRTYGAESEDYYETLDLPYRADNGPLDTVEELRLVKGFTKDIVSGGYILLDEGEEAIPVSGIKDLLTTYGDGKVNVNAASARVLKTLPGVDELVARAIIEEREGWLDQDGEHEDTSFESTDDFVSRIPGLEAGLKEYVSTDSQIFRIRSVGKAGKAKGREVQRVVWCIVRYARDRLTILRWGEED